MALLSLMDIFPTLRYGSGSKALTNVLLPLFKWVAYSSARSLDLFLDNRT